MARCGIDSLPELQIKFHRDTLPYREILQNGNYGA
jgi:hypothetical protein